MIVDRIEVYLDQGTEPVAVLKEPPYRWKLDTRNLPDGEHTLRVVTHFRGGGQEIRVIPFTVNNYPDVLVLGVDEGGEVAPGTTRGASRPPSWHDGRQPHAAGRRLARLEPAKIGDHPFRDAGAALGSPRRLRANMGRTASRPCTTAAMYSPSAGPTLKP